MEVNLPHKTVDGGIQEYVMEEVDSRGFKGDPSTVTLTALLLELYYYCTVDRLPCG